MGDLFNNYKSVIFIDSNVVLEGRALEEQAWNEIDQLGPILVLLLPTLLREVDSKKRDGRLGPKAREFNRKVAPLAAGGAPICVRVENPKVDIALAHCYKIDWDLYDDLDRTEGDSCLVAEALNVRNLKKEQAILISQDINPLFISQRHGLATIRLPDGWLATPEQSPQDKEITKLKRQLSDYAKNEPVFDVQVAIPSGPVTVYKVEALAEEESVALVETILEANPKRPQERSSYGLGLTQRYDYSYDERYGEYESEIVPKFVGEIHQKLEVRMGQIPVTFTFKNVGKVRAENMHLELHVIGGWLNRRAVFSGLYPTAPHPKSLPVIPFIPPMHRPQPQVGRHEVELIDFERSDIVFAQCEDFRQGQEWELEAILWLDPNDPKDVAIVVEITSANYHGEFRKIIKVAKNIESVAVFDLIEDKSGKAKVNPHTHDLFKHALENSDFSLIDWDRATDE